MPLKKLTLWEIMKAYRGVLLAAAIQDLQRDHELCDQGRRETAGSGAFIASLGTPIIRRPSDIQIATIKQHLERMEDVCKEIGLPKAKEKIGMTVLHLETHDDELDYSSLCADLRNALDMVMSDLWGCQFVLVDDAHFDYLENDLLFGTEVAKEFPEAMSDIKEAGNCIATDSGTAAVFHLMRAVEWGLRKLCVDLGVTRVRRSKHPKRKKYIPIEWAQWERMLEEVQKRVDKKIDGLAPGKRKQELQQFYYPALQDLRGFKDAFRNHVMHSRDTYSQKRAADICDHVRRFMRALAAKP
jgi:hypothetical protein